MKSRLSLTALLKQIRKCNEIFILQKVKFHLQTDILEQVWSPNKLLLKFSIKSQKLFF